MTFEKLAKMVADYFQKTMKECGYVSFAEMRRSFDWDMNDIKAEVCEVISEASKDAYRKGERSDFYMFDDYSAIQIGWDDMTWGNFKKMVFANLK